MPSPTILILDPREARRTVEAFARAGFDARPAATPKVILQAARASPPSLVLIRGELRGSDAERTLELLSADQTTASVRIALLCRDAEDARFVQGLRSGVVALLREPFHAYDHPAQVHALLEELPHRTGAVSGKGGAWDVTALVEHLRRTRRSGTLTVYSASGETGRALFARGAVLSADHAGKSGDAALKSMASGGGSWRFEEVGASAPEVVIDLPPAAEISPEREAIEVPEDDEPLEFEFGSAVAQPAAKAEPTPSPQAIESPETPIRILLVDDDDTLCQMFSTLFHKHGFSVEVAEDGYAGYEAALAERFELAVVDLNMPRMDGWGLLKLVRDDFRTRELPVAFLSCHEDYRETLRAMESGAVAYYSKSMKLDALATQVRVLLQGRTAARVAIGMSSDPIELSVSELGPQWVLRELAVARRTGVLETRDAWATYRIGVRDGVPVNASARAGKHLAEGERAFVAYVASRAASGSFFPGGAEDVGEANLTLPLEELLTRAATVLNANEHRLREGLLIQASGVKVDPELYKLYSQVGPRQWLETARLICEERLPPREVLARVDASPIDVEDTLKDLIRRGVVTLTA